MAMAGDTLDRALQGIPKVKAFHVESELEMTCQGKNKVLSNLKLS